LPVYSCCIISAISLTTASNMLNCGSQEYSQLPTLCYILSLPPSSLSGVHYGDGLFGLCVQTAAFNSFNLLYPPSAYRTSSIPRDTRCPSIAKKLPKGLDFIGLVPTRRSTRSYIFMVCTSICPFDDYTRRIDQLQGGGYVIPAIDSHYLLVNYLRKEIKVQYSKNVSIAFLEYC
jgi:hypothetical protein